MDKTRLITLLEANIKHIIPILHTDDLNALIVLIKKEINERTVKRLAD